MTASIPSYVPKPPSPDDITLGASTYEFWVDIILSVAGGSEVV